MPKHATVSFVLNATGQVGQGNDFQLLQKLQSVSVAM